MIGPKNHDRVLRIGAFFKRIQNPAQHGIGKMNRGQIALDSGLPLLMRLNVLKIAIAGKGLSPRG